MAVAMNTSGSALQSVTTPAPTVESANPMPFRPRCHDEPTDHFMSCSKSHCCRDAAWFGCFRNANQPSIAQCLPLSHARGVNGTCTDSTRWLCPESWLQPPSPPPPPPPPMPPSAPPLPPLASPPPLPPNAEPWHKCHGVPSDHYAPCMASKCCKDSHRYGCFRKRNRQFAMCMPFTRQTPAGEVRCADNNEWLCPSSWLHEPPPPPPPPPPFRARCSAHHGPSAHFGSCLESHCCQDRAFACFRSATKAFAQCLPLNRMLHDGECIDNSQWLCPETWLRPPPPPAAPSPPPVIEGCVGRNASSHFTSCLESRCCAEPEVFGCFKREGKQWAECLPFAQMLTERGVKAGWTAPSDWMTPSPPTSPPYPPLSPPPPAPPTQTQIALKHSKQTVVKLSTLVVGGGCAFALVCGTLGYVLFFRRRQMAPHLTSVVDDDAVEVGTFAVNGK